jgi:multidrug transporter EmrE-like cation transporter
MLMCIPVWFLGGMLVGMISPGRTFIEPAVAALLVAIPSTFLLIQSQTVRSMPLFLYVIFAGIGILLTLIGAYIGERIQLGPPPKLAD